MSDIEFSAYLGNKKDDSIRVQINFPCSQEDVNAAIKAAKITKSSECEIMYFDRETMSELNYITDDLDISNLSELNYLSYLMSKMNETDKNKLAAALHVHSDSISEVISIAMQIDSVMLEPNIFNYRQYGFSCWTQDNSEVIKLIEDLPSDTLSLKAKSYLNRLWKCVDLERYGELCLSNDNTHVIMPEGLLRFNYSEIFWDFDKKDIPNEHKINVDKALKVSKGQRDAR